MTDILRDEAIDLVAPELKLRGEDGQQLARRLRETSMAPFSIVTSRAGEADRTFPSEFDGRRFYDIHNWRRFYEIHSWQLSCRSSVADWIEASFRRRR